MLQFVQLRTQPDEVLRYLDKRLTSRDLSESIGQDVSDFWPAFENGGGRGAELPFSSWLSSMHYAENNSDPEVSLEQWKNGHQLPWLVAALTSASPDSPNIDEILADAEAIPPTSVAYLTVRYHMARLTNDDKTAIRIVDGVLKWPQEALSRQDANAFRRIALARATTIYEFARFAPRESTMPIYGVSPNIDLDSVSIFNEGLPLDELVRIFSMKHLPEKFHRELMGVIWTRSFVLKRWDVIRRLAPQVKVLIPESVDLVNDMLKESNKTKRQAIGAMLLARYPGIVGNVTANITYSEKLNEFALPNMHRSMSQDGERKNWWCFFSSDIYWGSNGWETASDISPPKFLSKKSIEALKTERQKLLAIPNATDYLSKIVMNWARATPRDPRLPQALYMLIRSSRGGCIQHPNSRQMFMHLHKYFPNNRWTKITRVYY
jgi:hypothetical protein